jgi:uncharacterized membrane protein YfcA
VLLLSALGDGADLQHRLKVLLGAALLVAATAMTARSLLQASRPAVELPPDQIDVRPLPTVAVGVAGGLIVGLTSVGSGSLMIVLLLLLYPRLQASSLVGTDLVQAIPLVASAALGHLLFGDFQLGLTSSLLIGALPGVYVGARLSSRAPGHVIRPILVAVLVASALKLLGAPTLTAAVAGLALGGLTTLVARRTRRDLASVATAPLADVDEEVGHAHQVLPDLGADVEVEAPFRHQPVEGSEHVT